jgi:DNA-binding CsgD family transcriptional regulator
MPTASLLERETERHRIARAIGRAQDGDGGVVLVEGAAGMGKSALLRDARAVATDHGVTTLTATASELDRAFAFGLVHQLLDGTVHGRGQAERERLLDGAAREAAVVFTPGAGGTERDEDPSYAVLHGLYWLVVTLAEAAPVALLVDDLHWADRPSLRFLEFLGRRLEGVGAVLVGTARPNEPGADAPLLRALAAGPGAEVVRPAPLSAGAAAQIVEATLGSAPEPAFATAVAEATGGNPLLLRAVAQEAAAGGVTGLESEVDDVVQVAGRGLADVAHRRLDGLGAEAVALARAAAVLSGRGRLGDLAALAGLSDDGARAAADRLAGAGLLEPGTWTYTHPVLRAAVGEATPPGTRSALHRLAAGRLVAAGADPAEAAVHLLASEPHGDPAVVAVLRDAARAAAAAGAPEVAVDQLRRALAEPPPSADVPGLLLELGELEVRTADPGALGDLTAALNAGVTGDEAARARAARVGLLLLADPVAALPEMEHALAEARDPALRLRLEALLLETSALVTAFTPRRRQLLAAGAADPSPSPVMLAHLAYEAGYAGAPVDETRELGRRAVADGAIAAAGAGSNTVNLLSHGLRYADDRDQARAVADEMAAALARDGGTFATLYLEHSRAYWHHDFGSVATAAAFAESGLDRVRALGLHAASAALAAPLAEALVALDRIDEAAAVVDALPEEAAPTISWPFAVTARGLVRSRQAGRLDAAEQDLRHGVALLEERGWRNPRVTGARLRLAELLAATGRGEEAERVAAACVEDARRAGLQGALGASLRVQGLAAGGERGLALLEEAAAVLAGTPLVLERGEAELDLGAALRRAGQRIAARAPLKRALDAAAATDSARLERLARDELVTAGGRADRSALTGPAALSPSERRVSELAAQGLTNRQIAETLWVTRKTVELHLRNAYAKLGIQARPQLAAALGEGAPGRADAA